MLNCLCIFKNTNSFDRISILFEDNFDMELIKELEELQEKLFVNDYDLLIIDENVWWSKEALELAKDKNVIKFSGNFVKIEEDIREYIEQNTLIENEQNDKCINDNIKVIYKEVPVTIEKIVEKQVEKIVYRSKNIRQEISSILSISDFTMRDSFAYNIAMLYENKKTLIIDLSISNKLWLYFDIDNFPEKTVECNDFKLKECCYKSKNISILPLSGASKKLVKSIIFSARDFENIIFLLDNSSINDFVMGLSHKIFVVTDPSLISTKNNMSVIKKVIKDGQETENIKFIIFDSEFFDKESIEYMYSGYEVNFFNRRIHLESINEKEVIESKKEIDNYYKALGIKQKKKFWNIK